MKRSSLIGVVAAFTFVFGGGTSAFMFTSYTSVTLADDVAEVLSVLTQELEEENREEGRCLTGTKKTFKWNITGIHRPPRAYSGHDGTFPQLASCPKETIAAWHNHPNGRCGLSEQDKRFLLRYEFPVAIVQCAPNAWAWWTRKQVESSGDDPYPPIGQFVVNTIEKTAK